MKNIKVTYKNGNVCAFKCYDWIVRNNYLLYTTRVGVEIAHLACINMDNIIKVEDVE